MKMFDFQVLLFQFFASWGGCLAIQCWEARNFKRGGEGLEGGDGQGDQEGERDVHQMIIIAYEGSIL